MVPLTLPGTILTVVLANLYIHFSKTSKILFNKGLISPLGTMLMGLDRSDNPAIYPWKNKLWDEKYACSNPIPPLH